MSPIDKACMKCGYNRYIGALDFHHRDPTQKEFGIARNQSRFGDKHKRELDKCDLLCCRCHQELHEKEYQEQREKTIKEWLTSKI